jgi:hypothetical protein
MFGLIFCQCSYSTILRGWHSGWSIPMPHRSLFYLLLPPLCSPPPRPPHTHCLTTSRCLRRQLLPTFADSKSFSPHCMMRHLPQQSDSWISVQSSRDIDRQHGDWR